MSWFSLYIVGWSDYLVNVSIGYFSADFRSYWVIICQEIPLLLCLGILCWIVALRLNGFVRLWHYANDLEANKYFQLMDVLFNPI